MGLKTESNLIFLNENKVILDMTTPLMPKATAVWLIDNTSLSFNQIADFCGMHELEIKGIADGDVAAGVKGINPIQIGQLTRDEITRCESNQNAKLQITESAEAAIVANRAVNRKIIKYTPVAMRENKPNAIAWLLKNCPEMSEKQIAKITGSTTPTVLSIKNKTHWNMQSITPKDPVLLGICSRTILDDELNKARSIKEKLNENTK
jgi:hypothetical protein